MLRTRLLTATAAMALFAAPAAFAQDPMTPAPAPQTAPTATPAPTPAMPAAPTATPAAPQTAPAAPQASPAAPTTTAEATTPAAGGTVIDVLKANGQFTTLVAALDAAQLTETLTSQPEVTIFAPNDAAFAALPEADRTRLMDPANVNELRQLLLYHVVVADVNSSQIKGAKGGVATASNAQVQLDGTADALKVDDATIVQADIDASNGAIFAIDKVLSPANSQAAMGDEEAAPAAAPAEDDAEAAPPADEATDAEADTTTEEEAVTPPAAAPTPPAATTTPPAPAAPATTAPNGQPAATTTTTSSPPVPNSTDGQTDGEGDDEDAPAPTPTPQS